MCQGLSSALFLTFSTQASQKPSNAGTSIISIFFQYEKKNKTKPRASWNYVTGSQSYSSSRCTGVRTGSHSRGLALKHCARRPSDSEVQLVTEKQVRPQSNELLSLKGRAGVDGSRNADPQALSCNLATQGFLCVITPHPAGHREACGGRRLRELWPFSPPGEVCVHTAVMVIPPTGAVLRGLRHQFRITKPRFFELKEPLEMICFNSFFFFFFFFKIYINEVLEAV